LFKELQKYDHEYVVCYDFLYWPYGDKDFDFVLGRVKYWIDFLEKRGVEKIILPPVYELVFLHEKIVDT
jgi:glutamate racemase